MIDRRLLTGFREMDKVFKRVAEGILVFDGIYDKLQQSTNQAQKEKLEQDLKREIKKLQRLRDQIKTWLSGNEVKDKKVLTEQRKNIEAEMERFKAVEREMKMKAYSREGLSAERADPKEKEKNETAQFVSSMLEELERQIETLEAEEEQIRATMKKGRKDTTKQERLNEIDHTSSRHRWHIDKLETILRMIENGTLATDAVNNLKEDIKYYVEENQDADFAEDEELYDELNLISEEELDELALPPVQVKDEPLSTLDDLAVSGDTPAPQTAGTESTRSPSPSIPNLVARKNSGTNSNTASPSVSHTNLAKIATVASAQSSIGSGAKSDMKFSKVITGSSSPTVSHQTPIPSGISPLPPAAPEKTTPTIAPLPPVKPSSMITSTPAPWAEKIAQAANIPTEEKKAAAPATASPSTLRSASSSPHPSQNPLPDLTSSVSTASSGAAVAPLFTLPPGLQDLAHAFDAARKRVSSMPPITEIWKMLERSFLHCPDSFVADKPRYYHPESPFPTPGYYPQEPLTTLENPEILARVDIDTLFYMFYYQQGTYQQYLAAKELKNRSWRFHKRFLTWFQRHEEPKVINNEFEQGTYRYFDFEGLWLQRRKSNFKFEYSYLEDEL